MHTKFKMNFIHNFLTKHVTLLQDQNLAHHCIYRHSAQTKQFYQGYKFRPWNSHHEANTEHIQGKI